MRNQPTPIRVLQTDFRSGEIDPQLWMRVDSKMYPSGAKSLKNCLLHAGGGVERRPGSTLLATLSMKRRLVPFEYDADEKYLLAFGAASLAIYDGNGTLVQSFSGATDCPWSTDLMVEDLTFTQAGDTMILCHASFKPKVLRRTSLTTFSMSTYEFRSSVNGAEIFQPYLKFEAASVRLAISSTSVGSGRTVTATSPIFSSAWIGDTIRIYGCECTVTGYTSTTQITVTVKKEVKQRLDPNPFQTSEATDRIEVTQPFHGLTTGASVTISGATSGAGFVSSEYNGSRTVTEVLDEDHWTFNAGGSGTASSSLDLGGSAINIATTSNTRNWDEQVFSARRGWPAACAFHEDRLWFGGSTALPDGIFASRVGQYYDFDVGEGEDDASIQVTVGSPRIAKIKHILSGPLLQIFTEGAEFVAKQSDGAGLTPSNVSVRPQTPYGCTSITPKNFDGSTIFVQANSKTVREFTYVDTRDGFQAPDLTMLSSHLVNGIVSFDVLYGSDTRTEQYAFFVNTDGTLAVLHSNRAEGLTGWVPWETVAGHKFESVCVLGSKVYAATLRDGTRYLEKIEMDDSGVLLDWSVSQTNGIAKTTWTLGASYASKTLHVVSNGWYLGTVTANGAGTITTPYAVTEINAGLDYAWEVIPLPPDMQLSDGPITGQKRRINAVTIHVLDTLSLTIDTQNVIAQQIGSDLSVPPAGLSQKIRHFLFGYDRDPVVRLTQTAPLPVNVLGLSMEISL